MDRIHLIVGNSRDYHAVAVQWAIRRMGHEAIIWDGLAADPHGQMSIAYENMSPLRLGPRLFNTFGSVWFRRQIPFQPIGSVHPDARSFLIQELTDAHLSFCASVESMSNFVIGGQRTRCASSKSYQLRIAQELGFKIPRTLISNNYADVMAFTKGAERLLVKHFAPHYFISRSTGAVRAVGPSVIRSEHLSPEKVEVCPCIYQEYIDKIYELRVTVIGSQIYTARLSSNVGELIDWRPAFGSARLDVEPFKLDRATDSRIRQLMARLNLPYGCIDIAVDRSGENIFLEINPGGQFLFIEEKIKEFPLLRAFASMLIAQSCDFQVNIDGRMPIDIDEFELSPEFDEWRVAYDKNASKNPKFVTFVE
ncbi:glutathione synthase/RimK-type ligase-like ATP-grasp enzyme [Fulvimonas soli]|uniref:Glutathione synthase/RimK-type ligase-like ATP-grasp enzyme n=2 Tax=Fulvimonas soli TaxID=155197 RepID=A0A316HSX6_9GAMM|nr:glutathione synthase/RimK-type ligase-like ATP-grasp enzyme [Fulvimonas soli]